MDVDGPRHQADPLDDRDGVEVLVAVLRADGSTVEAPAADHRVGPRDGSAGREPGIRHT
jgi:hypothetical protein